MCVVNGTTVLMLMVVFQDGVRYIDQLDSNLHLEPFLNRFCLVEFDRVEIDAQCGPIFPLVQARLNPVLSIVVLFHSFVPVVVACWR